MLHLPKKMLYALEAVVDIAFNARPDPVQSKEITQRQGIPQRYLEQVMQQLVHAGILKGVRGPRGGYRLARERRRITAGDIVRVISEGDGDNETQIFSSEIGQKVVGPLWLEAQAVLLRQLDSVTLEDLCRQANEDCQTEAPEGEPSFDI
ncbi:RrF2 family transcriptional regulator [Sneathiella chinensis]|uniref:Rrf2 family transcriptional regulator n=1 Tax=Sneathiella chinensis TaxID=349750 RepID=A0ABQ5U0M4_9PROT|nr:Rrf2 family transcriptional regulator [Sneathiella chinensis]GLQ04887.1 Rrf2 family transcriptional regulator [Sneathiella chinensis]